MNVPSKYEIYLQSEDFDNLRFKVFSRDGFKCVVCGSNQNIQPHHLTYIHIYHENLDELVTVCRNCHTIYHNLDNRRKYIEEKYHEDIEKEYQEQRQQEIQKIKEQNEERRKESEAIISKIMNEIKSDYLKQDYAKNGDLDMCNWSILNPVIESICKKYNYENWFPKKDLYQWFFYRRCELFLRCINQGIPIKRMVSDTKFSEGYLVKYYKKEYLEMKLREEKQINKLKEDITDEEY